MVVLSEKAKIILVLSFSMLIALLIICFFTMNTTVDNKVKGFWLVLGIFSQTDRQNSEPL